MTSNDGTGPPTGSNGWRRCTRSSPCPICGRAKFCSVTPDGSAVVCTKIESKYPTRNAAWLHPIGEPRQRRLLHLPLLQPCRSDLDALVHCLAGNVALDRLGAFAAGLGVSTASLKALGIGWTGRAWAFPMTNGKVKVVGIRYRNWRGEKWSEPGGREGIFRPRITDRGDGPLLLLEGPTSTAAALTLGFQALGRPSCSGGVKYCAELARGRDCVVVADADEPGQRGAEALADALLIVAPSVRVVTPPVNDLRDWLKAGASRANVEQLIAAAPERRLRVRYRS